MGAVDITLLSLGLGFLLLIIPIGISWYFGLGIIKSMLISFARMTLQLFLMALFLKYLFEWDFGPLNILWLLIMIVVAVTAVIRNSGLSVRIFALPVLLAFTLSVFVILIYFNSIIVGIDNILEAKYFIIIGGMLLGNSLRGNIIGITTFYKDIKRNKNRYMYSLSLGASKFEATMPYLRDGLRSALKPSIANMATIGIVSLPGMMTGQILGGSTPMTAIKYQIAIIVAIFVAVSITVTLSIILTLRHSFNGFGMLKPGIFKDK